MREVNKNAGGKWWKVDFHLHTPGSYDYGNGDERQKNMEPKDFLKSCMDKELDCIVVTDHNICDWVPKLRNALEEMKMEKDEKYREITIFPGIELNVQGNVHLLGVFDPSTEEKDLNAIPFLVDYNKDTETTRESINKVIEIISNHNGIAIPAHVDGPSGLFFENTPPSIIKEALKTGKILALEAMNPPIKHAILEESKLNVSFVIGSDSHTLDSIGRNFTWVKMGEPNIEAMRLALFDADDSVIRCDDISADPNELHGKTFIKSIEITNGKIIGRKYPYRIDFSPWLNSIIGGRGSGKSAILTFIRMILDRGDELPEILANDYSEFVKVPSNRTDLGMLKNGLAGEGGTTIKMEMSIDDVNHIIKWENYQITEYNAEKDKWEIVQDIKTRFPIRLFAQKQLYEMTKDTGLLFDFLDSQWNYEQWKEEFIDIQRNYGDLFRQKEINLEKQEKQEHLKVQLRDVKKKISIFETEETKSILAQKEELKAQRKAIKEVYDTYDGFIRWANEFTSYRELEVPRIPNCIEKESSMIIANWVDKLKCTINDISSRLRTVQNDLISLDVLLEKLPISECIKSNNVALNQVIEQLRKAGVDDIDRYTDLLKKKEELERDIDDLNYVNQELSNCEEKINKLKEQWKNLVQKKYDKRNEIIRQWNELGALRLSLIPFGDLLSNESSFRKIIRKDNSMVFSKEILEYDEDDNLTGNGVLSFMKKDVDLGEKLDELERIKKDIIIAKSELGKKFSAHLKGCFDEYPESIIELEMWLPEDDLKLELNMNRGGKPSYRPIDAGSPGQRTSAILSLILQISEMPIIIDQPEDDLDTRNITDSVVTCINEKKKKQQIIVVTHNPNIVVNTNSEQVIQLDFKGGQIVNVCYGALQNHNVRNAICEVMEGGEKALEKRYYRLFKALKKE